MRPTDADALFYKLANTDPNTKGRFCDGIATAMNFVLNAPTIDVAPVTHGRWVYDEESAKWGYPYICTAKGCGKAHNFKEKYCPNCGAKMDLEETY